MEEITVVVVDDLVSVKIDICSIDRLSGLVIDLLENIECGGRMTDLVHLDVVSGTSGDSTGLDSRMVVGRSGQLGDLVMVVSGVDTDCPTRVGTLDENGIEVNLHTQVLKVTDVGGEEVGEVGSCGYRDVVDKVGGVPLVCINREGQPVTYESEVHTYVVSRGGLPLEVRVVSQRSDGMNRLSTELIVATDKVAVVGCE